MSQPPLTINLKAFAEARFRKGISVKDLSDVTGVHRATIHRIENGETRKPSFPIAKKLADALEIDVADLLKEDAA